MKKIMLISIGILILFAFSGCEVTDVDIESRVDRFVTDLNNPLRLGIEDNFSGSETDVDDPNYWALEAPTWSPTKIPFAIDSISTSDSDADVVLSDKNGLTTHFRFEMVAEVSGFTTTWYIQKIYNYAASDYEVKKLKK